MEIEFFIEISLKKNQKSGVICFRKPYIKSASYEYRNKSARSGN